MTSSDPTITERQLFTRVLTPGVQGLDRPVYIG